MPSLLCLIILFLTIIVAPSSYAQTKTPSIPKFTPTVGWDISPTEMAQVRGLEALKLPCIMKAGYNNGFVIRFSGGGNNIMAMAVDFRQRIFTRDQVYNAMINVNRTGLRPIQATAFSESVLIFDMKGASNLYRQLVGAQVLGIEVEGNAMEFALGDIRKALQELEQCYSGATGQKSTRVASASFPSSVMKSNVSSSQATPNVYSGNDLSRPRISRPIIGEYEAADYSSPRVAGAELSKSMREPRFNETISPVRPPMVAEAASPRRIERLEMPPFMPDSVNQQVALPRPPSTISSGMVSRATGDISASTSIASPIAAMAPSSSAPVADSNVWNANAGDDMRAVLERWAGQAGVALQWDASNNGKVASGVNVVGTFEQAVQTLMAQNATALGLEADMKTQQAQVQAQQVASSGNGTSWQASMGSSKWVAASGASLRETLQSWSLKEGVAFLWKAGQEFRVKAPVQNNGEYTDALQELLNQYANDTMRPAAEYNVDPATGNKLLTVE